MGQGTQAWGGRGEKKATRIAVERPPLRPEAKVAEAVGNARLCDKVCIHENLQSSN